MKAVFLALLTGALAIAQSASDGSAQKAFRGEKIRMDLSVGDYDVVPSAAKQIHVSWVTGTAVEPPNAPVVIEVNGTSAHVTTSRTSRIFHATIEVPKSVDLEIHQSSGGLRLGESRVTRIWRTRMATSSSKVRIQTSTGTWTLQSRWAICSQHLLST